MLHVRRLFVGAADLPDLSSTYVPTTRSLTIGPTTADLSADRSFLTSVTNDAQTKASIVPNTAPSSAQILVGNAGGTAYAPQTLSGSGATASLSSAGVLTISGIANASLTNSSISIAGNSTALGGSVSLDAITGLGTTGLIKRTGSNTLAIATADSDYTANSFKTYSVSGQSDVIADSAADTLTLAAGSNITITTNASTDTITIAASGGGGTPGGSDTQVQFNDGGSTFGGDTAFTWDKTGNILTLGVAGSIVGELDFKNATSGTIALKPPTGALGTVTVTVPAATDTLVGKATTNTLTNKRITKRVGSTTSSATPSINTDNVDIFKITAQAAAITSMTTNLSEHRTRGTRC